MFDEEKKTVIGGLRTKGTVRKSFSDKPLITYITVVYNRENTIERCINSVITQNYENIEYIIVDGNSTDRTLDIIKQYEEKIDFYISENDNGIYDAMNKGLSFANGDLICFMNSDDFCLDGAAEFVAGIYNETAADIICGSRQLSREGENLRESGHKRYAIPKSVFFYVQMFHQSTYASKKIFEKIGNFNLKYKLIGDWVWQSHAIDTGAKLIFTDAPLAGFEYGGSSNSGIYKKDKEWVDWIVETFPALSYKDAKALLFSLDRGRNPMYRINVINRIAYRYFEDKVFVRTYYATVLNACTERLEDLNTLNTSANTILNGKKCSLHELWDILDEKLTEVCEKDIIIEKKDIKEVDDIKETLDNIYVKDYIKNKKSARSKDYFIASGYIVVSRWFSNSLFLTSHYYEIVRWVWSKLFKGEFIER